MAGALRCCQDRLVPRFQTVHGVANGHAVMGGGLLGVKCPGPLGEPTGRCACDAPVTGLYARGRKGLWSLQPEAFRPWVGVRRGMDGCREAPYGATAGRLRIGD